jgi:hypothetical protein
MSEALIHGNPKVGIEYENFVQEVNTVIVRRWILSFKISLWNVLKLF